MTPEGAQCAVHPDVAALDVCETCGSFTCESCRAQPGLCVPCAAKASPSVLAVATAVLGLLGFCTFVTGVVAVPLAVIELARIQSGRSPRQGRPFAQTGRALGVISTVLIVLLWLLVRM